MGKGKWVVKKALPEDAGRWFDLLTTVKDDFCGLDLSKDEKHRSGVMENIDRGIAIYVEDDTKANCPIIGAMSFSPEKNQITWLAVHPDYRRQGVASSLMETVLGVLNNKENIKVKTFRDDDNYGKSARGFYKKHGFMEGETFTSARYPHPVQVFIKPVKRI